LNQWLPEKLELCCKLKIHSVSSSAIKEVELEGGNVIDWQWIWHHFQFESFCLFGFLYHFALPTAHPGNFPMLRHGFIDNIQQAFYLRYLCKHGLKAQVVYLLFGLIGSILITEIRQNNNGVHPT
jgi:hypothetical protein